MCLLTSLLTRLCIVFETVVLETVALGALVLKTAVPKNGVQASVLPNAEHGGIRSFVRSIVGLDVVLSMNRSEGPHCGIFSCRKGSGFPTGTGFNLPAVIESPRRPRSPLLLLA